ncbi:MAG: hypothetical protein ACOY99_08230 [Pseudomonadota bacterium]
MDKVLLGRTFMILAITLGALANAFAGAKADAAMVGGMAMTAMSDSCHQAKGAPAKADMAAASAEQPCQDEMPPKDCASLCVLSCGAASTAAIMPPVMPLGTQGGGADRTAALTGTASHSPGFQPPPPRA